MNVTRHFAIAGLAVLAPAASTAQSPAQGAAAPAAGVRPAVELSENDVFGAPSQHRINSPLELNSQDPFK